MKTTHDMITKFEVYLLTEKRVAANTLSAYRQDLAQLTLFLTKQEKSLENVLVKDLKEFLRFLRTQDIGPRSLARKISTLKAFYTYLHERYNWENKAENLIFPKIKRGLPHFLTETEVEVLLQIADSDSSVLGKRNKVLLYLLYVSGMRISELTSMRVSSIHFDTGFIKVRGKGDKERMIPVPTPMLAILQGYLQEFHKPFMIKHGGIHGPDYLFPTIYAEKIKPITRQACWIILKEMWKKTGNEKRISPHQLRHSLATHMLKNGVDLRSLQLILGHENLMTVEIYTHVEVSHVRKVYDEKHPRSK